MRVKQAGYLKVILGAFKDVVPAFPVGVLTVVLLACILFVIQSLLSFTPGVLSVGASVFQSGHIHKLFLFPFYHRASAQLFPSVIAMALLSGSLEKGFGTVRFLHLFFLMSATIGVFYSFLDLLQSDSPQSHTEGLLPVALACVALTTMHTKMTKGFLCGVSFPTIALPWLLLILTTALIPHSVLPCNVIAVLVGWMYGKGWFSFLDLSEARAGILEKMMPFRMLRSIGGVMFVPVSTEERRRTLLPQVNPTPGSYPVQAYAPVSSTNSADTTAKFYEGWPNMTSASSCPASPLHPHGHSSAALGYGHSHGQL